MREGQPLPRPPLPAEPAFRRGRSVAGFFGFSRCPLTRFQLLGEYLTASEATGLAALADNEHVSDALGADQLHPTAGDAEKLFAAAGLDHADPDRTTVRC
jgi:hypothetical protein